MIVPKGVVEDVLVQVEKFYFPIDFIILDMQPISNANSQIFVILGRPFLATSNALINCRSGLLKLYFGNMTLSLIFLILVSNLGMKRMCMKLT